MRTRRAGIVLIFDEVITGFRLARGGAAERFGIAPDLATFGKVIGGGLPVGAFGGRREIMRHLAPEGRVYQAGTLSGNAAAMAAGLATLRVLEREDGWSRLDRDGDAPRAAERIDPAAAQRYAPLFHALLDRRIALAPSAYEVAFLSLAHTPAHLDALRDALAVALRAPAEVPA